MKKKIKEWENEIRIRNITIESYKEILKINKNIKEVLDWGCGNGLMVMSIFPKCNITGIEKDSKLIQEANLNAELNNINFNGYTLKEFIEKEEAYDIVIMIGVIEYLNDDNFAEILSRVYKNLKPDGIILTSFCCWRPYSAIYLPYLIRNRMSTKQAYIEYSNIVGFEPSKFSLKEIITKFKKLNFEIINKGGINPYPSWLWRFVKTNKFFITYNAIISKWYCKQYVLAKKK
jgi:2-polyprenyl-3-methyl-5-hydroxy-6-metoxy-1,4-benzoquinol methylase